MVLMQVEVLRSTMLCQKITLRQKCTLLVYFEWEKAMAPHSSTLAWKTPWTEEPGGLQSMGSLRVRGGDYTFTFHFLALEKEMAPTPVFLPGESQGRGSLVGCRPWGHRVGHY